MLLPVRCSQSRVAESRSTLHPNLATTAGCVLLRASDIGCRMEVNDVTTFLKYYENIRERTRRVVEKVPAEQFDFRYREGKFSFADLVRHLGAIERYMYAENVQGKPSRYPGHGPELADGHAAVVDWWERMHRESMSIFGSLKNEDLARRCMTPGGAELSVGKWLRAMVEHEVHHRGEMFVYLGLMGIEAPKLFGLTSEEVRARSISRIGGSGDRGIG
jgi:uncharacterized damage-inducible protein DinB